MAKRGISLQLVVGGYWRIIIALTETGRVMKDIDKIEFLPE